MSAKEVASLCSTGKSAGMDQPRYLSSFGRNRGRSLRPHQQGLVDELLPKLNINLKAPLQTSYSSLEGESKSASVALRDSVGGAGGVSDPDASILGNAPTPHQIRERADLAPPQGGSRKTQETRWNHIALEIGFGGGEHLLAQAAHHPDTLYIGCEPFINGVAKCLAGIEAQNLINIRLFTRDARELLLALPEASLDSIFILFPDPWPKARHNKRRLINHETLTMLARTHKQGGRLLIATDHVDYSEWILEHLLTTPHYRWTAQRATDWLTPPADWIETKYQRKTTEEGRAPQFFDCVRD